MFLIEKLQRKAGYGESSKWTHVAGSLAGKQYKVALWWATMNNLPYDVLQFFWFPLSIICGKIGIVLHNLFSSRKRFLCSELIATGFYKEGDYLFGKPVENTLPVGFEATYARGFASRHADKFLSFRFQNRFAQRSIAAI